MIEISMNNTDRKIIDELENKIAENPEYLDFLGTNTKTLTHGYHTYPAMMIPQLAKGFIELTQKYVSGINNIYDPFMGSGTTIVEGIVHGLDSYGIDINPLSLLMTKAKTTALDPNLLLENINKLKNNIQQDYSNYMMRNLVIENIPDFDRIDFWFKPQVIEVLQLIKNNILIFKESEKDSFFFFMAAFSETVRYVSNTRNSEFKLYRMPKEKLEKWDPDVINIFYGYLERNFTGNVNLFEELQSFDYQPETVISRGSNSKLMFKDDSFDLLVTSPPYGDSKTTVAYGQFSRLSLQWLDLEIDSETKVNQLDNIMLGGKVNKKINIDNELDRLDSPTLVEVYKLIKEKDEKRALEVIQFYIDLDESIKQTSRVMKSRSYQYWVVANRTVKDINIPTDAIISELFEKYNVDHLHNFYRNIPNKRMPSKNSPTNKIGKKSVTMSAEIILMLKKR
ncbi:hypothetical protein ACRCJU_09385 [Aerococcus urinaeequi]|uniref:hypothetical protein n=1 Tax=Aerococcus urinaeequi TaxID=51665 RepID=UPI003D6A378A